MSSKENWLSFLPASQKYLNAVWLKLSKAIPFYGETQHYRFQFPNLRTFSGSENWLFQLISVHFLATASTSGKAPFLSNCLRSHGCHDLFRKKEDRLMALTSPDFSTWVGEYIGNVRAAELKQVTWVEQREMRAGAFPLTLTSQASQD